MTLTGNRVQITESLFLEKFYENDELQIYLIREDNGVEYPETLGIVVKKDDSYYIGYGCPPIDEYAVGCCPEAVEHIDLSNNSVVISFATGSRTNWWIEEVDFHLVEVPKGT